MLASTFYTEKNSTQDFYDKVNLTLFDVVVSVRTWPF